LSWARERRQGLKQSAKKPERWIWIALVVFLIILLIDGVWSIAVQPDEPLFPYQLGRLLRIAIALCIGSIAWRLKERV
jgi:hypothetical protein